MLSSPNPFNDLIRWRAQAAEMRRRAEDAFDVAAARKLLQAAAQYDQLAHEAERRGAELAGRGETSAIS